MERIETLIVEDDKDIVQLYQTFLPDTVFHKIMVASGATALKLYEKAKPDIIILDVMIPQINGLKVLEEIRKNRQDTKTTIIMSTALSGEKEMKSCVQLGIQGYIVKPFKRNEIARLVLGCFEKNEPERAQGAGAFLEKP